MFKRFIVFSLALSFAVCAFGCKSKTPDVDTITGKNSPTPAASANSGNTQNNNNNDNEELQVTTFPPIEMTDGWPSKGIFANLPAYKHSGNVGEPSMPDTYNITGTVKSDFNAYCKDLEAAGYVKAQDSSEGNITRYIYENEAKNTLVTIAYWPDYQEIEILAETLDGSIDYSNKPTINIDWSTAEYLSIVPEYKEGGRIIDSHSYREPDSPEDFIKIVDADISDYNAYKAALLTAGFTQGNVANEGWHTESYYYANPEMPDFTVELYYELNGLTTDNIIIGITVIPKSIV
ncbi:MAG: hypothetical protein IJO48_06060 [Clostridia bacterium]|nr:hypothetical protein [Clostridia bacterium]